jgi:thiamine biosynthesis protein ThiS
MKIAVETDTEQELEVEDGTTIEALLARLGINRETVVVSLNGTLCTEEEPLKPGDRMKVIRVVTGG